MRSTARYRDMWRSEIESDAVPNREMYAEHTAPCAPPGGSLMNHRFRVGNWQTSVWIISTNQAFLPCRYNIIQISIEHIAGSRATVYILTEFIPVSHHN